MAQASSYDPNEWEYYFDGSDIKRVLGVGEDVEFDDDEDDLDVLLSGKKTVSSGNYTSGFSMYPEQLKGFDGFKGEFTYETKRGDNIFTVKVIRQSLLTGGKGVFNYDAI